MHEIGIPTHIKGYMFTREAINMISDKLRLQNRAN